MLCRTFIVAAVFTIVAFALVGSTEEAGDDLSLSALFDIDVTVASKRAEKISEAPGIVVGYTSSDINTLGYYTLAELADITSGYSSYYVYGERVFETRGQKSFSFNNDRHLLLYNGIPINFARKP